MRKAKHFQVFRRAVWVALKKIANNFLTHPLQRMRANYFIICCKIFDFVWKKLCESLFLHSHIVIISHFKKSYKVLFDFKKINNQDRTPLTGQDLISSSTQRTVPCVPSPLCPKGGNQKGERLLSFRKVRKPDRKGVRRLFPPFLSAQKRGACAA